MTHEGLSPDPAELHVSSESECISDSNLTDIPTLARKFAECTWALDNHENNGKFFAMTEQYHNQTQENLNQLRDTISHLPDDDFMTAMVHVRDTILMFQEQSHRQFGEAMSTSPFEQPPGTKLYTLNSEVSEIPPENKE